MNFEFEMPNIGSLAQKTFVENVRAMQKWVAEPDRYEFVFHTPIGFLVLGRATSFPDLDHLYFEGLDERGEHRRFFFSESQLRSFVIELRKKDGSKVRETIGFSAPVKDEVSL